MTSTPNKKILTLPPGNYIIFKGGLQIQNISTNMLITLKVEYTIEPTEPEKTDE